MPERKQAENILSSLAQLAEDATRKNVSFFQQDETSSAATQPNRILGRQKSVHHTLGGGKSADVLLWRNKKVSASVLSSATAVWILFEWLNYNFLTLVSFSLIIGMLGQFMWSNASGYLTRSVRLFDSYSMSFFVQENCFLFWRILIIISTHNPMFLSGSPSNVPRLVLPDELFINIAMSIGNEANKALGYLQDISCGGNLKQLLLVIVSLMAASIIGTWCNFLTVIYIGFVAAHTLPILYERYEDEFDSFLSQALGQIQSNYRKLDAGVLQRLPTRRRKYQ
ncbi:hypothetical protein QQ045_012863 [Rhodiola kirilowii]